MYYLHVAGHSPLSSGQLARQLSQMADREYSTEAMRHLSAIERIEARGIRYANEDFDVLSAAFRFVNRHRLEV